MRDTLQGETPRENKILIVDDNPTNLKVLFDYLSGERGNKIFVAKNGREALERSSFAHPDIILLDIMMPEMDGYETCRHLKENPETRDIPILFLTAFADTENKIKAFSHGAVDFIVKPFNQEEVLARIRTHLTISRQKQELEAVNRALEASNMALTETNAAKDKLFSIVAHDMRNSLFGVTGSIEMLQSFFDHLTDEEKQERLDFMAGSAHQMVKLFDNLFTWARMQTGSIDVVATQVNVEQTVDEVITLFCQHSDEKGVRLISDVPKRCTVSVDQAMLLFILRNLVHNALKFCEKGGEVRVTCFEDEVDHRIAVKDTGIGMPQELCETLFDIGSKSSRVGTANEMGSGLGLTVAKEFAEMNGGRLSVSSKEGVGTEVILSLPVRSQEAFSSAPTPSI